MGHGEHRDRGKGQIEILQGTEKVIQRVRLEKDPKKREQIRKNLTFYDAV